MNKKLIGLLATAGIAALVTGCDTPTEVPSCLIGRGDWVLKYKSTDSVTTGLCANREGDLVRIDKYQAFPQPGQAVPIPTIAIKPRVLRSLVSTLPPADEPADQRTELALGAFTSVRATNNLCTVPTLTPAEHVVVSGSKAGGDTLKGHDVTYAFSNVTFLDDPAHAGTQLSAKLVFTVDGCTANYDVTGLYSINYGLLQTVIGLGPAPCLTDADCSAFPQADSILNPSGSGIAPDYAVKCDVPLGQAIHLGFVDDPYGVGIIGDDLNGQPVGACHLAKAFPSLCDGDNDPTCAIQKPNVE